MLTTIRMDSNRITIQDHFMFGPKIKILPEQIFYQNEHTVAFVNLRPVVPGHVLVCPRKVAPLIKDLEQIELFEVMKTTQLVSTMLSVFYNTENIHYTIQDGPNAGQTVSQVHMHILPGIDQEILKAEIYNKARTLEDMQQEAVQYKEQLQLLSDI
ncbi:hypothetical protein FGO68_gene6870 [Halteria grandinella]|uniref:HIT domain-containing protein n=1 Tax=Halteria grandinella TaxID=5974 RepID=A0A8J8NIJ1_HALGN|nr:hypothetical protein FGO68_gene6870 [Halteria grandinella]